MDQEITSPEPLAQPTEQSAPAQPAEKPIEQSAAADTQPLAQPIEPPAEQPSADQPSVPEPTKPPPARSTVAPLPAPFPSPASDFRSIVQEARRKRREAKLDKIMLFVRQQGSINNPEIQKLIRVSDATATRYARELVRRGLLTRSGHTRATAYKPL